jgi:uncharacterized protein YhaN
MRSFQIYKNATEDQRKKIDRFERQTQRLIDEVNEAEAKYDYWKASLMNAADSLKIAEDHLCEYLEKLEKEMTR